MTPAERQRRRRARLRKEDTKGANKAKRGRARQKAREAYMPMPIGVIYWRQVTVTADEPKTIWAPTQRPVAAISEYDEELSDDDLLVVIQHLHAIARRRGLDVSKAPAYPTEYRHPTEGESVTIAEPRRPGNLSRE